MLTPRADRFIGIKKIKLEPIASALVDADKVCGSLEKSRGSSTLEKEVTSAAFYYEASQSRSRLLGRVNSATGERQTGPFENGSYRCKGDDIPADLAARRWQWRR